MDYRLRTDTVGITVHENVGWENLVKQVTDAMSNGAPFIIGAASQLDVASGPVTISGLQIKDAVLDGVPIMDGGVNARLRISNDHEYLLEFQTDELFTTAKAEVEAPGDGAAVREVQFTLSATREAALLITGDLTARLDKV